jgi:hypothetical protein
MKVCQRLGGFIVLPVNLANPVHRPAPQNIGFFRVASRCGPVNDIAMIIRDAVPEDASAACRTNRRSIAELCVADHHNDRTILRKWLSNKTPEIFKTWIKP